MKIWTDLNDVPMNSFCSEQMIIAPYLPIEWIQRLPDYADIHTYIKTIKKSIILVDSITLCDYIVYPKKLDASELLIKYLQFGQKHNKKVLGFYNDDNASPITINNLIVFRTSLYKSKQKPFEYGLPAWSIDFKPYQTTRLHAPKPVVGFCGYLGHVETSIRQRTIDKLVKCSQIDTNFLIRNHFWGGVPHDPTIRGGYIKNMQNSDYIVCTRGSGNFSYRLYETLSMGRIPLFIDTDCVYHLIMILIMLNIFR